MGLLGLSGDASDFLYLDPKKLNELTWLFEKWEQILHN